MNYFIFRPTKETLSIKLLDVLKPICCLAASKKKKRRTYDNMKFFVINKLSIYDFLNKSNEIDKLKHFVLDKKTKKLFQETTNPFPKNRDKANIWSDD